MDTDKHGFNRRESELTHSIIGAAFGILNALVVEWGRRGVAVEQPRCFSVLYKNAQVGEYSPDLNLNSSVFIRG